jgi:hypothetical protein
MARFLIDSGQALMVLAFLAWRLWRGDLSSNRAMWIAVVLAVIGLAMNLAVILINWGMPVRVTPEEIPEEKRPYYHSINPSTRLALLSDWIPLGNLLISPGDIVMFFAAALLLLEPFVGF